MAILLKYLVFLYLNHRKNKILAFLYKMIELPQLLTLSFNLSRKAKENMQGLSWNFYSVYIKFHEYI